MNIEVKDDDTGCAILIIDGKEYKLDLTKTIELRVKLKDCENSWVRKALRGE